MTFRDRRFSFLGIHFALHSFSIFNFVLPSVLQIWVRSGVSCLLPLSAFLSRFFLLWCWNYNT
jgi:hypothetical protein